MQFLAALIIMMRRYMNNVPYTESTVTTPQASFKQYDESGHLEAGMLEAPMELNPSYMVDRLGILKAGGALVG